MITVNTRKLFWVGFFLLILYGAYGWWRERPVEQPPGVLVAESPRQTPVANPRPWKRADYTVRPLARYELAARIVGKESYRFDATADISPMDLALGWGRLSDSAVLDRLELRQSSRWLTWRYDRPPIPPAEIQRSLANVHVIPADTHVTQTLERLRPGQVVELHGYLVEVRGPGGGAWVSSLSREDDGKGACEIMWVERVDLLRS